MRQRGKAKTKGRSPGLREEHHCQRQGRRGRLIWQSRSQQIVIFLGLGLISQKQLIISLKNQYSDTHVGNI
jgi:hypothetical protein